MHPEPIWPTGKYRLKHEAYIARMPGFDHELLPSGTEIIYSGKPGPHMEPLDESATEACRMAGAEQMNLDPFGNVPMTSAATDDEVIAERVAAAVASAFVKMGLVPAVQSVQQAQQTASLPQPPDTAPEPEPVVPGLEALIPLPPPPPPPLPPPPPPPPPPAATGKPAATAKAGK